MRRAGVAGGCRKHPGRRSGAQRGRVRTERGGAGGARSSRLRPDVLRSVLGKRCHKLTASFSLMRRPGLQEADAVQTALRPG